MPTPRRDFLRWLGVSGAFAATGVPASSLPHAGTPAMPVSEKWDMRWCDRITGKVRAVFDSPGVSDGDALPRAMIWRDEQTEVYGTPISEASAVVVFRHQGISLVMDNAYWKRFDTGKHLKIKNDKTKQWVTANPIASAGPDTPPGMTNYNIPAFIASGGIVLACDFALTLGIAPIFKAADKVSDDEAYKRARAHLIPGVILQPSGVFATLRAQQAGCHYLLAG